MAVKVSGQYPKVMRTRTSFPSLDAATSNWATGEFGFPTRGITEIYGRPESGKTSLSLRIAATISQEIKSDDRHLVVIPLDTYDPDYSARILELAGFDGTLLLEPTQDDKGKERSHEDILQSGARWLRDERCGVVILDNITQVKPLVEEEGDYESAYMGKRAQLVGKFSRDVTDAVRRVHGQDVPKIAIAINQIRKMMGTKIDGWATPGGDAIKEAAMARIRISRDWELSKAYDGTGKFVATGELEKLRFGGRGREFKFFMIPGYGPHPGLSALYDGFDMDAVERGSVVKFKGKSLGYLSKLVQQAENGQVDALDDIAADVYSRYEKIFKGLADDYEKRMAEMRKTATASKAKATPPPIKKGKGK